MHSFTSHIFKHIFIPNAKIFERYDMKRLKNHARWRCSVKFAWEKSCLQQWIENDHHSTRLNENECLLIKKSSYNVRAISCNNTWMKRAWSFRNWVPFTCNYDAVYLFYKTVAQFFPGSFVGIFLWCEWLDFRTTLDQCWNSAASFH